MLDPVLMASLVQMHQAQQFAAEVSGANHPQAMGYTDMATTRAPESRRGRSRDRPGMNRRGDRTRHPAPTTTPVVASFTPVGATAKSSLGTGMPVEAAAPEAAKPEVQKCHLHVRAKASCKFCQRHNEAMGKVSGSKELSAAKESVKASLQQNDDDIRQRPLEIADPKRFGFSPVLRTHVSGSAHYKELLSIESFDDLVAEMYEFGDSIFPYMHNSATTPTALFCCLYRLFTLGIDRQQLLQLLEDTNNPRVRCMGLLYVRLGLPPEHLWPWLGEYTLDDQEFRHSKDSETQTTIGEFAEELLSQDKFSCVVLPRLPVPTRRQLQLKLAPINQYRKRARANSELRNVYRHGNVHVEIKPDGPDDWLQGTLSELIEDMPSRPKASVRLKDGSERVVHLGRVVLTDRRFCPGHHSGGGASSSARGSSRSRSPGRTDWAREKGRSDGELVDELRSRERERAVCATGKDYARRPIGYKHACAMSQELGSASARLAEDETTVVISRRATEGRRSPSPRGQVRNKQSAEHQARMQQLFEKYGMAKGAETMGRVSDVEGPDFVRLG